MSKLFFFLICIVNIGFPQTWVTGGTWNNPVSGGESIPYDSLIYVFGGFSESNNSSTDEIRIYNTATNVWENKTTMQQKRSYFSSGIYHDSIFFFGGILPNNSGANRIEVWNRVNKSKEYDENNSFNRIKTTGVILNNSFYFFGGNCGVSNCYYLVEYNIPGKEITFRDSTIFGFMPSQQMCATDGRYIYLFGGVFIGISNHIYRFDPSDKSFIKLNVELKTARAGGRAVTFNNNNKIIIIGGYNETMSALESTEILNISNDSYSISQGPSMLSPRKNFMSVNLNGTIYVLGGVDSTGNAVNTIEKFNGITSAEEVEFFIPETYLAENYPNPFNPSTVISFLIQKRSFINLKVYDITGKEVAELINREVEAGKYKETFDANKYNLSSGVYFYRLKTDGYIQTRKMVLIK